MKKLTQIFASLLSLVFLCTGSIFTGAKEAKAATVDDVFTSVNVYNEKGEALTEGLALWERFQIDANFAFNYGKFSQEIQRVFLFPRIHFRRCDLK